MGPDSFSGLVVSGESIGFFSFFHQDPGKKKTTQREGGTIGVSRGRGKVVATAASLLHTFLAVVPYAGSLRVSSFARGGDVDSKHS